MSSQDVINSVSKKLKYYFELKRLEDGFDLTGPDCPKLDHPPLRARPTLMYDGLHDRPLKHYFNKPEHRVTLTKLTLLEGKDGRQKKVKRRLEHNMRQYTFLHPALVDTYYNYNRPRDRRTLKSNAQPGHGGTGLKRSKMPHRGSYPLLRSTPPAYITRGETNRLVNTAAKLLVATEIVDLKTGGKRKTSNRVHERDNKNNTSRRSEKKQQSAPKPFETNRSLPNEEESGESSENTKGSEPELEEKKPGRDSAYDSPYSTSPNNQVSVQYNTDSESSLSSVQDDTDTSSDEGEGQLTYNKQLPHPPTERRKERPRSANIHRSRSASARSNGSGQDNGTQTGNELLKQYDPMEKVLTEGEEVRYRVHVFTGNKLGASTTAIVRLSMIGEKGRTEDQVLDDSLHSIIKFQKNQEDVFDQKFLHVGNMKKISIGHDRKELGYGWYLDKVIIKDTLEQKRYTIPCETWLSSKHGDGSTVKEFNVRECTAYNTETDRESGEPQMYIAETSAGITPTRIGGTPPESEAGGNNNNNADPSPTRTDSEQSLISYSDRYGESSSYTSDTEDDKPSTSIKATPISPPSHTSDREVKKPSTSTKATPTSPPSPRKRNDDFFDQKVVDKDYSNVIDKFGNDQGKEDFHSDRAVHSPVHNQPAQSNIRDDKNNHSDSDTARLSRGDVLSDSDDDQTKSAVHRISYQDDARQNEQANVVLPPRASMRRCSVSSTGSSDSSTDSSSYTSTESSRSESSIRDSNSYITVHQAALKGNLTELKRLTQENPRLKLSTDEHGWLPLHVASNAGREDVVQWLCVNVIDLDALTSTGYTAMHLAAMQGHKPCMVLLAAMGAMVDYPSMDQQTPLHLAAKHGHTDTVRWIITNNKVDKNSKDMDGRTALDLAYENTHTDVIRLLADPGDNRFAANTSVVEGSKSANSQDGDASTITHAGSSSASEADEGDALDKFQKKHDEELMEKKKAYEDQHKRMSTRGTSFLDTIRDEFED